MMFDIQAWKKIGKRVWSYMTSNVLTETRCNKATQNSKRICHHFFLQVGVAIPIFTGGSNAMPVHPHRETMAYNAIGGLSSLSGTTMP